MLLSFHLLLENQAGGKRLKLPQCFFGVCENLEIFKYDYKFLSLFMCCGFHTVPETHFLLASSFVFCI